MKWQSVLKMLGTGTGGILFVLAGILNLTGMSYTIPPDITCTDCYSEVQVNSTFWEIKVEHAKDKPILFKKSTRGRTLWLNLDKVKEFIPTSPEIEVEILVPTTKKYSTFKHPEFGYLRPLKDGDSLIARKNKYNPNGDRFIVHGLTKGKTVKWGLEIDSILAEGIEFDPLWESPSLSVLIMECKNETKYNYIKGIETVWSVKNNTFEKDTIYTKNNYLEETCIERGVKLNGRDINYKQSDKACLRTGNILCCWLYKDGGWNVESRKGSSRTTIRNGESGSCVDLDNNLKELSKKTDFEVVKI